MDSCEVDDSEDLTQKLQFFAAVEGVATPILPANIRSSRSSLPKKVMSQAQGVFLHLNRRYDYRKNLMDSDYQTFIKEPLISISCFEDEAKPRHSKV